ncbi:DUF3293 domain-containing protein [Nitrosospira sp. NRS527]|uniref:DUF3293 domain-containing protein n=1 Tax=Nitrosospira sp. NRS527 TaxID=155925 RepID=UPI001BCB2498|nr:DUF3293 domain-containing protein [Nitrosospira sp. NRS527]
MPQSKITGDLVAAYRSAHYRVDQQVDHRTGPGAIILRVDQYSEPLSQLFSASGHRCTAFITACNPFGQIQSPETNREACAHLFGKLRSLVGPGRIIEGEGFDPSGKWPAEKSFIALGLDLEASCALGKEFGQNAIVWAGADAVPRLILLR